MRASTSVVSAPGHQRCTLATAPHLPSYRSTIRVLVFVINRAHLKFMIYGIWSQASKQASKHTHARAQCSPTIVGLAKARPNYCLAVLQIHKT